MWRARGRHIYDTAQIGETYRPSQARTLPRFAARDCPESGRLPSDPPKARVSWKTRRGETAHPETVQNNGAPRFSLAPFRGYRSGGLGCPGLATRRPGLYSVIPAGLSSCQVFLHSPFPKTFCTTVPAAVWADPPVCPSYTGEHIGLPLQSTRKRQPHGRDAPAGRLRSSGGNGPSIGCERVRRR